MAAVTGAFSRLLVPGIRNVFFMYKKDAPTEYERIFKVETSSRAWEENLEVAALGIQPMKPQGSPVIYQDMIQGEPKRFTHLTFGLGFRASEEMLEDDLYDVIKKNGRALKRSALVAREVLCFNVVNNSFTTEYGYPKKGVLQPLVGTTHNLLGGGVLANRPTNDVDISYAALEAAVLSFNTMVDDQRLPVDVEPKTLLFHPSDLFLVTELLESEYRPFTANNEINPLKGRLTPIWSRYLTDPDAWWVLTEKDAEDGLTMFNRRQITLQNGDDFDTGDAKFKCTQRISAGCSEWRNLYGSSGGV